MQKRVKYRGRVEPQRTVVPRMKVGVCRDCNHHGVVYHNAALDWGPDAAGIGGE